MVRAPKQARNAFERIRADTLVGMAFSNLIALAIIVTAAATLNKAGITSVETSAQAAEALKPMAGEFAFVVFALGIVATGLLAIPVLAGSAAYAIGEACRWPIGLSRRPNKAVAFYSTLTAAAARRGHYLKPDRSHQGPLLDGGDQRRRCGACHDGDDADDRAATDHGQVHYLWLAAWLGWASTWRWPHASSAWSSVGSANPRDLHSGASLFQIRPRLPLVPALHAVF